MGFNLNKALHALVGFAPVVGPQAQKALRAQPQNMQPLKKQVPKQQIPQQMQRLNPDGSLMPNNPSSMRQNILQVGQPQQGDTGQQAVYGQPQQGFGQQVQGIGNMPVGVQGLPGYGNTRQLQRPSFNPQVEDQGYYYY